MLQNSSEINVLAIKVIINRHLKRRENICARVNHLIFFSSFFVAFVTMNSVVVIHNRHKDTKDTYLEGYNKRERSFHHEIHCVQRIQVKE